jgi:hypothetical protein
MTGEQGLIAESREQALPFSELRAHIRGKPEMTATTASWLRKVNAAGGNPMKMPQSCYARDPRKCVRFRVTVTRQT